MRLRVKRLLQGGVYLVSLGKVEFTRRESKKIRRFGTPNVDLSSEDLGVHRLDAIDLSFSCRTVEEAERIISAVRQKIRQELIDLSAQKRSYVLERFVALHARRKALAFGLTCATAILLAVFLTGGNSTEHKWIGDEPYSGQAQTASVEEVSGIGEKSAISETAPTVARWMLPTTRAKSGVTSPHTPIWRGEQREQVPVTARR